jgi:hypothetical protein
MTHHSQHPLGGYQGDDPPPEYRKNQEVFFSYVVNLARFK